MKRPELRLLQADERRLDEGLGLGQLGAVLEPGDDQVVDRAAVGRRGGGPSRAARPGRRRASGRAGCGGPVRRRRPPARPTASLDVLPLAVPLGEAAAMVRLQAGPGPRVGRGEARQGLGVRRGLAGDGESPGGPLEVEVGFGDAEQGVVGRDLDAGPAGVDDLPGGERLEDRVRESEDGGEPRDLGGAARRHRARRRSTRPRRSPRGRANSC